VTPPLRTVGGDVLRALRTALAESGYTPDAITELVRVSRFVPPADELPVATQADETDERLGVLVTLLALGRGVPAATARAALAPAVLEDVQTTGLVTVDGGEATANYRVMPHAGLLLAGDGPRPGDRDVVSAFTDPSLTLAQLTPRTRRRSMLDLGTGSGILALLGAAHSDTVTAVDVNPRALMFARFNAALNECDNLELVEGSWFEPLAGRDFDLIVGNPPYVVSPDHEFTYRDSGMPGASMFESLCRETAAHLKPGGLAILLASWPHGSEDDWAGTPLTWATETGCDALVLCQATLDPLNHAVRWNVPPVRFLDPESLRETVARWLSYYRTIGAGAISFGTIALRRRTAGIGWASALKASTAPGGLASEQLVRVLDGQELIRSLDDRDLLAKSFSLPNGIDISQRFQRPGERFVARPAMVRLADGLGVSAAVDPDALEVVFACDGRRPLSEIVDSLAARRGLDAQALARIAVGAIRELLAHGLTQDHLDRPRGREDDPSGAPMI
jgi:SAM-dependent methyltransferase